LDYIHSNQELGVFSGQSIARPYQRRAKQQGDHQCRINTTKTLVGVHFDGSSGRKVLAMKTVRNAESGEKKKENNGLMPITAQQIDQGGPKGKFGRNVEDVVEVKQKYMERRETTGGFDDADDRFFLNGVHRTLYFNAKQTALDLTVGEFSFAGFAGQR
jgi:hypothetical protein